jgi:hypothetical protein
MSGEGGEVATATSNDAQATQTAADDGSFHSFSTIFFCR